MSETILVKGLKRIIHISSRLGASQQYRKDTNDHESFLISKQRAFFFTSPQHLCGESQVSYNTDITHESNRWPSTSECAGRESFIWRLFPTMHLSSLDMPRHFAQVRQRAALGVSCNTHHTWSWPFQLLLRHTQLTLSYSAICILLYSCLWRACLLPNG